MERRVWIAALVGGGLLACGRPAPGGGADSTAARAAVADSVAMGALSWRFASPPSWDDRVRIVDDPEGLARLKEQGIHSARIFEYLPRDTSIVPQTLLGVWVYDSTSWARLEREDGPPQGELVARGPGVAYVVGFPQSNPFAAGSVDSVEFDRRTVTMDYVKGAFHVVR
jgi:hypothetical protein